MLKKILVAGAVVGALGYLLRNKIVQGYTVLEERFLTWAAEDPTEDDPTVPTTYRGTAPAPVPDMSDSFPVGKRHGEENV